MRSLPRQFRRGLFANQDFVKLWSAETISIFGSLISGTAIAFAAVLTLDAGPYQIAILSVAQITPAFLLSLFARRRVDRLPRRPIMITADLARAVLLASIPVAALFDVLRIEQLYVVAALASVFTTFFDIAYQAYLPTLVEADQLVEGNSKLTASAGGCRSERVQLRRLAGAIADSAGGDRYRCALVSLVRLFRLADRSEGTCA